MSSIAWSFASASTTREAMQGDLDVFLEDYNTQRPHQGRWCYGKTPMQTFLDSVPLAEEKHIAGLTATIRSHANLHT